MGAGLKVASVTSAAAVVGLVAGVVGLVVTSSQQFKQQLQAYMKRASGICLWLLSPAPLSAVRVWRNSPARIGMSAAADSENARQLLGNAPKSYTSTVALVPPEDAWPSLQAVRASLHDKGLYRWPPHINLLYPFVQQTFAQSAVNELAPALAQLSPFHITLDSLGIFGGRHRGVLYCHASSEEEAAKLRELQGALQAAIPHCDEQSRRGQFVPHMTLAHFESAAAAEAARDDLIRSGSWVPVTVTIGEDAVHIMRRCGDEGQFEKVATLPLGGGLSRTAPPQLFTPPRRFSAMLTEEPEWVREARVAGKRQWKKGSGRGGSRRPRRSEAERAAIAARTPEQIEQIRAERAAKRAKRSEPFAKGSPASP